MAELTLKMRQITATTAIKPTDDGDKEDDRPASGEEHGTLAVVCYGCCSFYSFGFTFLAASWPGCF